MWADDGDTKGNSPRDSRDRVNDLGIVRQPYDTLCYILENNLSLQNPIKHHEALVFCKKFISDFIYSHSLTVN